ncbi:MAG: hypothetical protein R3E18_02840 [Sphingomonadaceae bacterium]
MRKNITKTVAFGLTASVIAIAGAGLTATPAAAADGEECVVLSGGAILLVAGSASGDDSLACGSDSTTSGQNQLL